MPRMPDSSFAALIVAHRLSIALLPPGGALRFRTWNALESQGSSFNYLRHWDLHEVHPS